MKKISTETLVKANLISREQQNSRPAKFAAACFNAAAILDALTPLLVVAIIAAFPALAFAQPALPDGGVFSDGQGTASFGNTAKNILSAIKWGMMILGIVSLCWMVKNIIFKEPFFPQLIGAFLCFGISGVIYVVYRASQGQDLGLGIN